MTARWVAGVAVVTRLCVPAALADDPEQAAHVRADALARARLWREPPVRLEQADLLHNPRGQGSFDADEPVACRFRLKQTGGHTPKFYCTFRNGEVLKVKYGRDPEVHTEVAASRLLLALGAGADRVYLVRKLRCFGCPSNPQELLRCISSPSGAVRRACRPLYGTTRPGGAFVVEVDYGRHVDFGPVAIERALEGEEIRSPAVEGWGWEELDHAQSRGGRGSRAERDALRLVAVLLGNWDNREDNQRLVCLPGVTRRDDPRCPRPFAYMADVGATFGRARAESRQQRKLDLEAWRGAPVWDDRVACTVSIASPRFHGATFGTAVISEAGRRFLAARVSRLRRQQLHDLFVGAGFADYEGASPASRDVDGWVGALESKIRQVTEGPPCPAA